MRITFNIPEFTRNERKISIVTFYTLSPLESPTSSWMTRSRRSRRRDKGLLGCILGETIASAAVVIWSLAVDIVRGQAGHA